MRVLEARETLLGALGGPRDDPRILRVARRWPRSHPDSKIHDFAETVAYFNEFWVTPRLAFPGSAAEDFSVFGVGGGGGSPYTINYLR